MDFLTWLTKLFGTFERASPQDVVDKAAIQVDQQELKVSYALTYVPFTKPPIVKVQGLADTNSMEPLMDKEHNTVQLFPADPENHKILCDWLKPGDIAVWNRGDATIIHRIKRISQYNGQRRFHFQGDNNGTEDAYVILDQHIVSLCVGVIY